MLCCAQLCQRVLSQPAANPHSRSVTPNEPTFAQRTFWAIFFVTTSSPYSLMHILPTSSSKSAPGASGLFDIWNANRTLATVWCTLCHPHLPKVQIELSLQSCALFVGNFARFDAHNHFHPWIHTLPNCYTSQLFDDGWLTWWCGWHDEMMWLPWWWKCWPWQSSVTRKLSS